MTFVKNFASILLQSYFLQFLPKKLIWFFALSSFGHFFKTFPPQVTCTMTAYNYTYTYALVPGAQLELSFSSPSVCPSLTFFPCHSCVTFLYSRVCLDPFNFLLRIFFRNIFMSLIFDQFHFSLSLSLFNLTILTAVCCPNFTFVAKRVYFLSKIRLQNQSRQELASGKRHKKCQTISCLVFCYLL